MKSPRLLGPHLIDGAAGVAVSGVALPIALVDAADYERVSTYRWFSQHGRRTRYACALTDRGSVAMHRFVMEAPAGIQVDHINGDGLDNRRANLRLCTAAQNSANRRKCQRRVLTPASSQFKGVGRSERGFYALCAKEYLGIYKSEEAAARAYDDAARTLYGEFARLNFPRPGERSALLEDAA